MSSRWTDEFLDEMRKVGDPPADAAIEALLQRDCGVPLDAFHPGLGEVPAFTTASRSVDIAKLRRAEDVFELHGPAILMVLGLHSLPATYAAKRGVQVLYRTSDLLNDPVRRLSGTTRVVVDVMKRGALDDGGSGVRVIQRVRLLHAVIRRRLGDDPNHPWDPALGVPINQEDLAGTLMTFSYLVIEGLAKLGIRLSEEDQEAYLHRWVVTGRLLGVDERLLPADMSEARALTRLIRKRQIMPSPEGRALMESFLRGIESLAPRCLAGFAPGMVRLFLEKDIIMNEDVAGMLGVPPAIRRRDLAHAVAAALGTGARLGARSPVVASIMRSINRRLVGWAVGALQPRRECPFARARAVAHEGP